MVKNCWVVGCKSKDKSTVRKSFFSIPKERVREDGLINIKDSLIKKRRALWLSRLGRDREPGKHTKICSDHFVKGKPCELSEIHHPDWAPSLRLNLKKPEPKSHTTATKRKRPNPKPDNGASCGEISDGEQNACTEANEESTPVKQKNRKRKKKQAKQEEVALCEPETLTLTVYDEKCLKHVSSIGVCAVYYCRKCGLASTHLPQIADHLETSIQHMPAQEFYFENNLNVLIQNYNLKVPKVLQKKIVDPKAEKMVAKRVPAKKKPKASNKENNAPTPPKRITTQCKIVSGLVDTTKATTSTNKSKPTVQEDQQPPTKKPKVGVEDNGRNENIDDEDDSAISQMPATEADMDGDDVTSSKAKLEETSVDLLLKCFGLNTETMVPNVGKGGVSLLKTAQLSAKKPNTTKTSSVAYRSAHLPANRGIVSPEKVNKGSLHQIEHPSGSRAGVSSIQSIEAASTIREEVLTKKPRQNTVDTVTTCTEHTGGLTEKVEDVSVKKAEQSLAERKRTSTTSLSGENVKSQKSVDDIPADNTSDITKGKLPTEKVDKKGSNVSTKLRTSSTQESSVYPSINSESDLKLPDMHKRKRGRVSLLKAGLISKAKTQMLLTGASKYFNPKARLVQQPVGKIRTLSPKVMARLSKRTFTSSRKSVHTQNPIAQNKAVAEKFSPIKRGQLYLMKSNVDMKLKSLPVQKSMDSSDTKVRSSVKPGHMSSQLAGKLMVISALRNTSGLTGASERLEKTGEKRSPDKTVDNQSKDGDMNSKGKTDIKDMSSDESRQPAKSNTELLPSNLEPVSVEKERFQSPSERQRADVGTDAEKGILSKTEQDEKKGTAKIALLSNAAKPFLLGKLVPQNKTENQNESTAIDAEKRNSSTEVVGKEQISQDRIATGAGGSSKPIESQGTSPKTGITANIGKITVLPGKPVGEKLTHVLVNSGGKISIQSVNTLLSKKEDMKTGVKPSSTIESKQKGAADKSMDHLPNSKKMDDKVPSTHTKSDKWSEIIAKEMKQIADKQSDNRPVDTQQDDGDALSMVEDSDSSPGYYGMDSDDSTEDDDIDDVEGAKKAGEDWFSKSEDAGVRSQKSVRQFFEDYMSTIHVTASALLTERDSLTSIEKLVMSEMVIVDEDFQNTHDHSYSCDTARPELTEGCFICKDHQFYSETELALHRQYHSPPNGFECSRCLDARKGQASMSFDWKSMKIHLLLKHEVNMKIKCDLCEMLFPDYTGLEEHLDMHRLGCTCGYLADDKQDLTLHKQSHTKKQGLFKCQKCIYKSSWSLMKSHILRKHPSLLPQNKCPFCRRQISSNGVGCIEHYSCCDKSSSFRHKCMLCTDSSDCLVPFDSLYSHLLRHLNSKDKFLVSQFDTATQLQSKGVSMLELYHLLQSKPKVPFLQVSQVVKDQANEADILNPLKYLKCLLCKNTYKGSVNFVRHLKFTHFQKEDNITCKACGQVLKSRKEFIKHQRELHKGKVLKNKSLAASYQCESCSFSTKDRDQLKSHFFSVHQAVEFKCKHCTYSTSDPIAFKKHMCQTVSLLNKYACNLCAYTTMHQPLLASHYRVLHALQGGQGQSVAAKKTTTERKSGAKPVDITSNSPQTLATKKTTTEQKPGGKSVDITTNSRQTHSHESIGASSTKNKSVEGAPATEDTSSSICEEHSYSKNKGE